MRLSVKDVAAGAIFIVIGAWFALTSYTDLRLGTAFRMGPGYVPLMLAGILIVLGVVIAGQGLFAGEAPFGSVPWRGLFFILLSPILFGLFVRPLGLVPAMALVAFVSSFASARMTVVNAVLITVALTVFCTLVFKVGLGLPMAPFGPYVSPFVPTALVRALGG